jgi:hypothetical protein
VKKTLIVLTSSIILLTSCNQTDKVEENKKSLYSEMDSTLSVIYDHSYEKYYLLTNHWAIELNDYSKYGYREDILNSLKEKYEQKVIEVNYTNAENIDSFQIVEEYVNYWTPIKN